MSVARMREAIFGVGITFFPGYRFSHPGYDVLVIASWDRWIRHRPALDESLRLDVGSMTPFLSDFLPRSEATKQSIFSLPLHGLLRFARNDGLNYSHRIRLRYSRSVNNGAAGPWWNTAPRSSAKTRSASASTKSRLCSTITMEVCRRKRSNTLNSSRIKVGASPSNGSSSSNSFTLPDMARATATICCSPPDR